MENIQNMMERVSQIKGSFRMPANHGAYMNKQTSKGAFEKILQKDLTNKSIEQSKQLASKGTSKHYEIQNQVRMASKKYRVPESLISAVIKNESNYNPWAISSKGAKGLMQLMPNTARELGVRNLFDINENIDGGTKYLSQLLEKYDGDFVKSIAAYNAGPANVSEKIPDFKETKSYVKKVMNSYLKNMGI